MSERLIYLLCNFSSPDDLLSEYEEIGYSIDQISRITGYSKRLIKLKLN